MRVTDWVDKEGNPTQTPQALHDALTKAFPLAPDLFLHDSVAIYGRKRFNSSLFTEMLTEVEALHKDAREQREKLSAWEQIEQIVTHEGVGGCLMSSATKTVFSTRYIKSDNIPLLQRPNLRENLTFIFGASGSGKTWFMMNCKEKDELAIYTFSANLAWNDSDWSENNIEERNQVAIRLLLASLCACFPAGVLELLRIEKDHPLLIIVDELGSMPQFLRALCSFGVKGLEERVQKRLRISNPCSFIVGGTGQDSEQPEPTGSQQATYTVHFMPTNRKVWEHLFKIGMQRSGKETAKAVAVEVDKSERGKQLATNPRVAAIMYNRLFVDGVSDELEHFLGKKPLMQAVQSVLPEFFTRVVREFRSMNRMSTVTFEDVWEIYRSALAFAIFQQQVPQRFLPRLGFLTSCYGVLVDTAYWADQPKQGTSDTKDPQGVVIDNNKCLWSPKLRYTMSPAQVQMFRMGYGFQIAPLFLGEGFEESVPHFLEVLLLAANKIVSLGQVLNKLGLEQQALIKLKEMGIDLDTHPAFTSVEVVQSRIRVDPSNLRDLKAGGDWHRELGQFLRAGKAVVLLNAPGAEYADLIVLVPNCMVLLCQSKYYRASAPLSMEAMLAELGKMEHTIEDPSASASQKGVAVKEPRKKRKANKLSSVLCDLAATESLFYCFATTKENLPLRHPDPRALQLCVSAESIYPIAVAEEGTTPLLRIE